jgi:uncharacterized membrane protein YvbJ
MALRGYLLSDTYGTCPHCGQKLPKGAMKCLGCGGIQQSVDERKAAIQKLKETRKSFDFRRLVDFIVLLLIVLMIYLLFSEQISQFIKDILA